MHYIRIDSVTSDSRIKALRNETVG